MAGTEGSGQTELLTGWSCVVHRPSEDPEPSELPSTVDIAAFSSNLNVEPAVNPEDNDSCDSESDSDTESNNSGSEVSGSCSQSDSSDSETSTSSQGSSTRSSSPEFSVTSSQTNGLRLKIATVRKSCASPMPEKSKSCNDKTCDKNSCNLIVKSSNLSSSSESPCSRTSSDSSTDSEALSSGKSEVSVVKNNEKCVKDPSNKTKMKQKEKKVEQEKKPPKTATTSSPKPVAKSKTRPRRTRKMASLPLSRGSTGSSSESEDSETDRTMLASCSLQEIRQEDLAAILPDQQDCDAFGGFDCRPDKSSPNAGDGSGSDMELPQQAVNALIQRTTESSSESESRVPLNPNTLYANSLLQQFVAQTQMLNTPCSAPPHAPETSLQTSLHVPSDTAATTADGENNKRRRGRPKKGGLHKSQSNSKLKKTEPSKSILNLEYCGNPNVSPDSGIQNSSDHVSSPEPSPTPKTINPENDNKKSIAKTANKNNDPKTCISFKSVNNRERQIKEQLKLPITSNSFDRVLYGNADRVLYPPRRKVGRPPITRKGPGRPPKHKPLSATSSEEIKPPDKLKIDDSKIISSLKHKVSEKTDFKTKKKGKLHQSMQGNNNENLNTNKKERATEVKKDYRKLKSTFLQEICEKVSKRLDTNNKQKLEKFDIKNAKFKGVKSIKKGVHSKVFLTNKNKVDPLKMKYTTLKNSKVMHSKHKNKKHKKCNFKILKPITEPIYDPKLLTEIDKLVADFVKFCCISSAKPAKENVPEILKVLKKVSKKRKTSEYNDRKKKKQNISNSFNKDTNSNEQRLPLKKRHYHLSTNTDSNVATSQPDNDVDLKSKQHCSTKDTKSPLTYNKLIVEKTKCVHKNVASATVITCQKTPADNSLIDVDSLTNSHCNNGTHVEKYVKAEAVRSHIDEAIEACITKYSSVLPDNKVIPKVGVSKVELHPKSKEEKINNTSHTTTTPKKRHRLEQSSHEQSSVRELVDQVVQNSEPPDDSKLKVKSTIDNNITELKSKKVQSPKPVEVIQKKTDKKPESVAQIITRKKNRLEDLTLTLAHKVNSKSIITETLDTGKKDVVKHEDSLDNLKKRKDVSKVDQTEDLPKKKKDDIDAQKRKKDKNEDTENMQKRRKQEDKLPNIKQKTEVNSEVLQKRKKEVPTKEDEAKDSNQKRKKHGIKLEEPNTKSSTAKRMKQSEVEKLDSITTDKPTGIFMPTVDIELQIPASKIQTAHTIDKPHDLQNITKVEISPVQLPQITVKESVVEEKKCNLESDRSSRKKSRKRRAINRTGFPTVKKKKKRLLLLSVLTTEVDEKKEETEKTICDRVPQEGEKYSAFLQRTEKSNVSNAILEKLQKSINNNVDQISKMDQDIEEDMYELGYTRNGRPSSRLSIKRNRSKDVSPATSVDICLDKNSKSSFDDAESSYDMDDLSLEARLELLQASSSSERAYPKLRNRHGRSLTRRESRLIYKRQLKDLSPASSIEYFDKKLRDVSASGDESKRSKKLPRWRKRYLVAGLFSDYYKENDEVARLKRAEAASKSKIIYNPEEHPYGLLPPPYHCGKYLRCRKIPFQLPYDLWWQHTNSQLPGRDIVPSWNYRKIRTNVYNVKTTGGTCEPQACNCTSESGCGDDCINRLVLAECPATHRCQNQKIQKHEWAPGIEKFMTADKGWGVRTKLPIKASEFILEYVGEVVSDQEFKERMASRYAHDTHHYCLHLDGGLVIDGHRMGGDGRFVNHSCEPNCEMQKWSVNGQFRMALFALRDIEADEELTYDYNFSLFNPAEGQECKCGSENCRGVIGGKSQRVRQSISTLTGSVTSGNSGRIGRPRKNQAKRTSSGPKEPPVAPAPPPLPPVPLVKPMTGTQKTYVREHHCFLLRNLNKAKHMRERSLCSISVNTITTAPIDRKTTTFINHLNALRQPRNMKTRRLAQVEDNPELKKTAQLASILRDLLNVIRTYKDENNELLCTTFMTLPSKRKLPEYYQRICDPIDLSSVEHNVTSGVYKTVDNFNADVNRIFNNAVKFFGRTSEPGIAATRLKKLFCESKQQSLSKLEAAIGAKLPPNFVFNKHKGEEEDVIRCICGMFRDEGLMIQCERCLVWQHCECVQADVAAASYHCEKCVHRKVDYEISLNEFTEHGHRYYMTLLRGDLQLRQGDTVYVLRDIPITGTDKKHTYDTIGKIEYSELDIFRIERLWKDCKTGKRFAYGHHYLRPHETFHEPTRKFFTNEVMRVPLYEAVPVELVISHCWVLDINTYCKGRPIGAPEEHIYICEYRVDKSARLFSKISKNKYPICIKSYAFERFNTRLKISRTYTPHDLDPAFAKPRGRKAQDNEDIRDLQMPIPVPIVRTRDEKKTRLNKILLALLNKMPTKQTFDVSYLLEGGRRRKKPVEK